MRFELVIIAEGTETKERRAIAQRAGLQPIRVERIAIYSEICIDVYKRQVLSDSIGSNGHGTGSERAARYCAGRLFSEAAGPRGPMSLSLIHI